MNEPIPLQGRIALVTGATRGIGRASALALAGAGAHVIAVGRTQGALEELHDEILAIDGPRPTIVALDLTDGDSIDRLGYEIFRRHERLDILVHAAAMLGGLWPVAHIDPKLWDKLIATNLSSAYRLIRATEPLLRQSEAARALFLTTGQGVRRRAFWGGYAATKSALDTLVRCWADEVEHTNIRTVIVDPGAMRTRMRSQAFPGENPATLPDPSEIGPMIVALAGAADPGLPTETARFSEWKAARAPASA